MKKRNDYTCPLPANSACHVPDINFSVMTNRRERLTVNQAPRTDTRSGQTVWHGITDEKTLSSKCISGCIFRIHFGQRHSPCHYYFGSHNALQHFWLHVPLSSFFKIEWSHTFNAASSPLIHPSDMSSKHTRHKKTLRWVHLQSCSHFPD